MPSAPVETKVVAQTGYATAATLISWVLLTVFHVTLPSSMTTALPGIIGVVVGAAAGYLSKHTPRLEEVVAQVESVQAAQQAITAVDPITQQPAGAQ